LFFLKQYKALFIAAFFLVVAVIVAFPFYQFYVDPDATAYLTLAKRYAAGDYSKAVNGYWSPWSVWCTAIMMKLGVAAMKAAIVVNTVGALGFLLVSYSLFLSFRLRSEMLWLLSGALSVFLLYAVYWQTFGDLWQCFFLLAVLRIMLLEAFTRRRFLWVAAGVLGALAYFSKAYAFPFFFLQILVGGYFIFEARLKANRGTWAKMSLVCGLIMLIVSFPWLYLLQQKYGFWMTGTAGSLNTSWFLVGHPYWQEGIAHLLPPVFSDSPSYWEDPFYVNGATPHFWNSPRLVVLQIVRLGYNLLKLVQSSNELSCFFAVALVIALVVVLSKKVQIRLSRNFALACLTFLLFPLGYLLINFQGRYLWFMVPLSMVILATGLQRASLFHQLSGKWRFFFVLVLAVSYVVYPVLGLKEMYRSGQKEYHMAEAMKAAKIKGSFASNIPYSPQTQHIVRLSYFSQSPYYYLPRPVSKSELLQEMRKYCVRYYFHFFEGDWDNFQLTDEHNNPFPEIAKGKITGLKVYEICAPQE